MGTAFPSLRTKLGISEEAKSQDQWCTALNLWFICRVVEGERCRRDKQTDPLDSNESISDNVGSDLGLTGTSLSDILPSETGI